MPGPIARCLVFATAALSTLASCTREDPADDAPVEPGSTISNRLAVPPEVVANLGITFEQATRGKLGSWIAVPGELYVPSTHRWSLRAPARGRLLAVLPRWRRVEAGEVVAELLSPELREAQQDLSEAITRQAHATEEAEAARQRLREGEAHLEAAMELRDASLGRLENLRKVRAGDGSDSLGAREILSAQYDHAQAGSAALESAVRRDELRESARRKELLSSQAQLRVDQVLSALSLLSGRTPEELLDGPAGARAWRTLESVVVRAPAAGTIVDIRVSRGETVDEGASLGLILDPSELRFRGWLPEGDLSLLRHGAPVRIELPSVAAPLATELIGPLPVADPATRRVQVEAIVPNPEGALPQGLSATAHVRVEESAHEEVVLPASCVVADGLEMIVFRRDPEDAGFVVRTPVELGLRAAGQVEVLSGVLAGDQVVRRGIYQLKQTGLGKAPQGGHFHADGTWHAEHE